MFVAKITDRHELRLLQTADAAELFALVETNRTYLKQWLPWLDSTTTIADSQTFIQSTLQQFVDNQGFVAAICDDRAIVGVIGFNRIDWLNRVGYIGYWLAADSQGKGLMSTSCKAIVNYAFGSMKLNRLVIACASDNQRSRSIPERLGFTHEGTTRDAEWLYDRFVDHEIYALLQRDWKQS
jgi:ribosomal-protein-serine acetyltransferase